MHLDFFFLEGSPGVGGAGSAWGKPAAKLCESLCMRRVRTRLVKRRSTFCAVLALVSRNSHPNLRASAAPSSRDTSRSYALSHLFPTSIKTGSERLTRNID